MSTMYRVMGTDSGFDTPSAGVELAAGLTLAAAWDTVTRVERTDLPAEVHVVRVVGPHGEIPFERRLAQPEPITTPVAVVDWQDWRALWDSGIPTLGLPLATVRDLILGAQESMAIIEDGDRAELAKTLAAAARKVTECCGVPLAGAQIIEGFCRDCNGPVCSRCADPDLAEGSRMYCTKCVYPRREGR